MYLSTSVNFPDGELLTGMNAGNGTPLGIINLGDSYIAVKTDADAERLIRAAHRLIAMRHMLGRPHPFEAGDGTHGVGKYDCVHCGMNAKWDGHAEPAPGTVADAEIVDDEPAQADGDTWTTAAPEPPGMQPPRPVVRIVGQSPRPVVRIVGPHPDASAFRLGFAPDESAVAQ